MTSAKVKNGSLLKVDFKAGQVPRRPSGPAGPAGTGGPTGAAGPAGASGPSGPPGPLVETLPSGKTLRGTYGLGFVSTSAAQAGFGGLLFEFPLASAPAAHFIAVGASPPAQCPGSAASPEAASGHLCVYEANRLNGSVVIGTAYRFGATLEEISGGAGSQYSSGTWAVTG